MTDPRKVIAALLNKTVANGATEHEAASAKTMAEKLAAKHGISMASVDSRPRQDFKSVDDLIKQQRKDEFHAALVQRYKDWFTAQQEKTSNWTEVKDPWESFTKGPAKKANHKEEEAAWNHAGFGKAKAEDKKTYKNVGTFCEAKIMQGYLSYDQIAEAARNFFGGKTSAKSVAWYASKLRKEGKIK